LSRIGLEISRLRKERNMTQKQLAKLAGVSEGYIDEVEAGKKVLKDSLISRVYKILGQEAVDNDVYVPDQKTKDGIIQAAVKPAPKPVQQVWNDALGGILKTVNVYDYKMDKAVDTKQLPIVANKVEGYPKDKVFYLQIQDNDMTGFRISKGDLALACATQEIEKDAIFFIEYGEKRAVRQIKRLEGDKILLVCNAGNLATEMATVKTVKVLGRLIRLEILL
jgi:transcriptional regulator with XRE-family HTH domain